MILTCALPHSSEAALKTYCSNLLNLLAPQLPAQRLAYLSQFKQTGTALRQLTLRLLGEWLKLTSNQNNEPGETPKYAFAYSADTVFCGQFKERGAIDAEKANLNELPVKYFFGKFGSLYHNCPQPIRIWTIYEATAKLIGLGICQQSFELLKYINPAQHSDQIKWQNQTISWRSCAFLGHWLSVAVFGEFVPAIKFKICPRPCITHAQI